MSTYNEWPLQFQINLIKYIESQTVKEEIDAELVSGSFSNVDQMNQLWKKQAEKIFDLDNFVKRLNSLLVLMNCPWNI